MPASWGDLFDRGADYGVDLEAVRATADELSATVTEAETDGETTASTEPIETSEGNDA